MGSINNPAECFSLTLFHFVHEFSQSPPMSLGWPTLPSRGYGFGRSCGNELGATTVLSNPPAHPSTIGNQMWPGSAIELPPAITGDVVETCWNCLLMFVVNSVPGCCSVVLWRLSQPIPQIRVPFVLFFVDFGCMKDAMRFPASLDKALR